MRRNNCTAVMEFSSSFALPTKTWKRHFDKRRQKEVTFFTYKLLVAFVNYGWWFVTSFGVARISTHQIGV